MKKFILSAFILGSFGLYVLSQSQGAAPGILTAFQSAIVSTKNTQVSSAKKIAKVKSSPTPVATASAPVKTGLYNDGTYTGSVADAYYGNVQVEAVIANGKISDVRFLDYPQDRSTSRRINSQAMPYLTQEAISIQSANVDRISGASDTSAAFQQSLASALAQAKA